MNLSILTLVSLFIISSSQPGPEKVDVDDRWTRCNDTDLSIYHFKMETLDGKRVGLDKYQGQVLLVVNVATMCAFTEQYVDFNLLLEQYSNDGFTTLAFPCNQFGLQEPGKNHEILEGLKSMRPGDGFKPHPNLHIFGKIEVNGANHNPLYEFLKGVCPPTYEQIGMRSELMYDPIRFNDITWNFEKFLIDRKGKPRYRFHPTNWIGGQAIKAKLEELLKEDESKVKVDL